MPTLRKLTSDEVRTIEKKVKGQRKLVEEEYDSFLNDYTVGDYGEAELGDDENRITVRNRLKAAAVRRSLTLDFKRTKGNVLRFKVISPPDTSSLAVSSDQVPPEVAPETNGKPKGRGKKKS